MTNWNFPCINTDTTVLRTLKGRAIVTIPVTDEDPLEIPVEYEVEVYTDHLFPNPDGVPDYQIRHLKAERSCRGGTLFIDDQGSSVRLLVC